jgi:DNA polymerase
MYQGYQGEPAPWRSYDGWDNEAIERHEYIHGAGSYPKDKPISYYKEFEKREKLIGRRRLHIDIETFSKVNLKNAGLYKYAADCEILLIAVGYDKNPVILYDLATDVLPDQLIRDLRDPTIIKIAHNAAFEIACLSACLEIELDPAQWLCSMVLCGIAGLPFSLDQAGAALNLDIQKDKTGTGLIRFWCIPCKPTKANGHRVRNLPEHEFEKWFAFGRYCVQDVYSEIAITEHLTFIRIPPIERLVWNLDQKINSTGIKINMLLVRNAIEMDTAFRQRLIAEAIKITRLSNPNSIAQIRKWIEDETGELVDNLRKAEIPKLIERFDEPIIKRILTIRQELSKTSVKKYAAMLQAVGSDSRVRGLLQYYGANRTGRWGGRLIQPQNLPKGKYHDKDLNLAREIVLSGDADMLETLFGAIPDTLSQLIRTAFIPAKGKQFVISDYSAIEARVIAWLAGERWRMEVFATHGRIYEASASQMFKVPIEAVTKTSDYRAKGKISELALGYQGGVNALIKMGALDMGLTERELQPLVTLWREANPSIVKLWYDVDRAAKKAIDKGEKVFMQKDLSFEYRRKYLIITLPSGRSLYYVNASLVPGDFGVQILYWGMDQTTKKWTRIKTYGGKLVENIVQAIARDVLAQGLLNLANAGIYTAIHVHDETVNECDESVTLEQVNERMCDMPAWAKGLILSADGFVSTYYKKD